MSTWLVSYADAAFQFAQQTLVASAARHGVEVCHPWTRDALVQTPFYRRHRAILDRPRGGGYWLWKPYILEATLHDAAADDVVVYADAGIEIVGDLQPLFAICRDRAPVLLFAGHYDDAGVAGPNVCGKWTKRDCFVAMACDEPRYHEGQMLDASVVVLRKTPAALAFVREWLLCCVQPHILTDEPNVCGLPNLANFISHRHDQSVLSLLAIREGLEVFRHPSQRGNHLKLAPYREPGEWLQYPYGAKGVYDNSPYGTLLNHHRGALGQRDLEVVLTRTVAAPQDHVFAAWSDPAVLRTWGSTEHDVVGVDVDLRVDGKMRLELVSRLDGIRHTVRGTFLEVQAPARLVYRWSWQTQVTVDFEACGSDTTIVLRHRAFPTERLREAHARAWSSFLDTLAAAVSGVSRVARGAP